MVADFPELLPELRPGWWVLRGYLVVWVVAGVFFEEPAAGVVPRINNSALFGLLLAAVGIWASVRLGKRARSRPPSRSRRIWGALFVGLLLVVTFGLLVSSNHSVPSVYYDGGGQQTGLVDANGTEVFNVYPRETDPFAGPRPNFVAPRLAPSAGPSNQP